MMTVAELIEALADYPLDAYVDFYESNRNKVYIDVVVKDENGDTRRIPIVE